MSNDPIIDESKALRELLNSKQEAFFQLSSQFDELSAFVNTLRNDYTRLTAQNTNLIKDNERQQIIKEQLEAEISHLKEQKEEIQPQVTQMKQLLTDNQDTEAKYLALCKTLDYTNQLIIQANQTLTERKQEIKETDERREQMSERLDYYREQVKERKEYLEANEEKFKRAERLEAKAIKAKEESEAQLEVIEQKKKEFLENPRSFGLYLSEIKNKTGVDVLDLMHKHGIK